MTTKLIAIGFAAAIVFVSAGRAQEVDKTAGADEPVKSVDVQVGDSWVYKVSNEITGQTISTNTYTVTEEAGEKITVFVKIDDDKGKEKGGPALFDMRWGMLRHGDMTFSKPDMTYGVATPFKVGSKWKSNFDVKKANWPQSLRGSTLSTVVGREKIILPSGDSYDAYKIDSEMLAKARDGSVKVSIKATNWYDPTVNRYIQRTMEMRTDGMLRSKEKEYLISYNKKDD